MLAIFVHCLEWNAHLVIPSFQKMLLQCPWYVHRCHFLLNVCFPGRFSLSTLAGDWICKMMPVLYMLGIRMSDKEQNQ